MKLTGIAAQCDWVFLSDSGDPHYRLINQRGVGIPQTIFVSLRGGLQALEKFATCVLPSVKGRFVLISGSEDLTIPQQIDRRWPMSSASFIEAFQQILCCKQLIHWYVENLDTGVSSKISAIPLGYVSNLKSPDGLYVMPRQTPLSNRKTLLMCCHRIREGPQWEERREMSDRLEKCPSKYIEHIKEEIPINAFEEMLSRTVFVICVNGGGLDPCPKAFQALQFGAVPIVRSSLLDPYFKGLPVWIVDHWGDVPLDEPGLRAKHEDFANRYPPVLEVASRLSVDYWWQMIREKANHG